MNDFATARTTMVDCQIRPSDITDHRLLQAFSSVPRDEFVPARARDFAYIDEDIVIEASAGSSSSRYLMAPRALAKLIDLANVGEQDIVLDVGCGSGYSSAVLSKLCDSVVALEVNPDLAATAESTLQELSYDNAVVVTGSLKEGYPGEGPYDVIFVGGSVGELSEPLKNQLKDGGRLVVVEGMGNAAVARLYTNHGGIINGRSAFNLAVKPLPGFEKKAEFAF